MAWIKVIPPDDGEASAELRATYDEVTSARRGRYSPIMQAMSLKPQVMRLINDLAMAVTFGGSRLGREREELLAVAISSLNGCGYCTASHGEHLRRVTRDDELVRSWVDDWRSVEIDPGTAALLRFAEKLTLRPAEMSEDDVEELRRAGFGDEEVLDVVLITAMFAFMNRLADGTGLGGEEAVASHHRSSGTSTTA